MGVEGRIYSVRCCLSATIINEATGITQAQERGM